MQMARKVLFAPSQNATDTGSDRAAVDGAHDSNGVSEHVAHDEVDGRAEAFLQPAFRTGGESAEGGAINREGFGRQLRRQAYQCAWMTAKRLVETGYLENSESSGLLESFKLYIDDLPDKSSILDLLAFIVWIRLETKDEKAVREIRQLTQSVTPCIPGRITHSSFAHLVDTPTEIYQGFPVIYEVCSTLMCPIIQAHEKDFFTVVSINPITASAAALIISKVLEEASGIKPFAFVMTTDSNAWSFLNEKHFGA